MPYWVSKILIFLKNLLHKKTEPIILEAESITIVRHAEENTEENASEVLNKIINTPTKYEGIMEMLWFDELLFAPCPLINCQNYDNCSKNLFKCDWIREEVLMMKNETN